MTRIQMGQVVISKEKEISVCLGSEYLRGVPKRMLTTKITESTSQLTARREMRRHKERRTQ